jgi:hypothetical protein
MLAIRRAVANWIARRHAAHPIVMETDLAYVASRLSAFDRRHMIEDSLAFLDRMKTLGSGVMETTAEEAELVSTRMLSQFGIDLHSPREALIKNGTMLLFNLTEQVIQLQKKREFVAVPGFMVWVITLRAELVSELQPVAKEMWSLLGPYSTRRTS